MHALLESIGVMSAMTVLLFLLGYFFLVGRRVYLGLFVALPLSGGTRVVGVLGGAGVRWRGRTAVWHGDGGDEWMDEGIIEVTHGALWGLGRALIERRRPPTLTTARGDG